MVFWYLWKRNFPLKGLPSKGFQLSGNLWKATRNQSSFQSLFSKNHPSLLHIKSTWKQQQFACRGIKSLLFRFRETAEKAINPFRRVPNIPNPQPRPNITFIHNQRRVDNFSWLEDHRNQQVIEYLVSENNYTEAMMEPTRKFQEKLYLEMLSRAHDTEESIPEVIDNYAYYMRLKNGGDDLHLYCRREILKDGSYGPEQNLLDLNHITERFKFKYASLGVVKLTHNHQRMAFTVDNSGSETYTAFVVDFEEEGSDPSCGFSGKVLEAIPNAVNIEWANDCQTLFYTVFNHLKRPSQLFRHRVGTSVHDDVLIYEESDDKFILDISRTKDKCFLTVNSNSRTSSEVRIINSFNPFEEPVLIQSRKLGLEYFVDHSGDYFFIVTNANNAENYKVIRAPEKTPWMNYWEDIVPVKSDVKIEDMDIFEKYCVLYEKKKGLPNIRILCLETLQNHILPLPEEICVLEPGANQNFKSNILRFSFSSPLTPTCTYNYSMNHRQFTELKRQKIPGHPSFDASQFICERKFAHSTDSVQVPITIIRSKFLPLNGKNPMLVSGYGSYGISMEPDFNAERISLLNRGWILAFVHVRGGSELGRHWYESAKNMKKHKSFEDFASSILFLYSQGYSSKNFTAAKGVSAGGLLVAGTLLREKNLFSSAILKVPYVDVLTAMLNPHLPLTIQEYEEWGNPTEDSAAYQYIKSYSPYENIHPGEYPAMMVTASMKDTRVSFWQPTKFVARLRKMKTDNNLLLLKTDWNSGHFGAAGYHNYLREIAFEYAFLHHSLKLNLK